MPVHTKLDTKIRRYYTAASFSPEHFLSRVFLALEKFKSGVELVEGMLKTLGATRDMMGNVKLAFTTREY